eukprot:scaffold304_cov248-Pinguiococcus_pyrenoidosus.AAC.9
MGWVKQGPASLSDAPILSLREVATVRQSSLYICRSAASCATIGSQHSFFSKTFGSVKFGSVESRKTRLSRARLPRRRPRPGGGRPCRATPATMITSRTQILALHHYAVHLGLDRLRDECGGAEDDFLPHRVQGHSAGALQGPALRPLRLAGHHPRQGGEDGGQERGLDDGETHRRQGGLQSAGPRQVHAGHGAGTAPDDERHRGRDLQGAHPDHLVDAADRRQVRKGARGSFSFPSFFGLRERKEKEGRNEGRKKERKNE